MKTICALRKLTMKEKLNDKPSFTYSMKKIFVFTIVLLAATAIGCGRKAESSKVPSGEEAIPVKISEIVKEGVSETISASGQFTTDDETMLSFKTGGPVKKIFVKEGASFHKGEVLATLDLTEISALVNQARLGVEKATRDFQRAENLYKDSVATLEQYQNAKTALDLAKQQLAAAQFNETYSEIRASGDGVVLKKMANEGQIVGSGMPVLQTNSKGNGSWMLKVAVSDHDWARIAIGDPAKIFSDANKGNSFSGKVTSKSESADMMTGSFTVEITLENAKSAIIASGMFGKAEIGISKKESLWRIPYESLLDGNGNTGFVFVTNDQKTAAKVPVSIERIEKNDVLINGGLDGLNYLIVSGSAYLSDKSNIRVEAQ